jgi:hypothetical protein
MKKFIINVSIFFVIFILINIVYLIIIIKTDWNFRKRIESRNFINPEYELLVLGNSLASDGIDTKLLTLNGVKSYNLAIGGSSIKTNYLQLREYLEKYDNTPKFVLLALGSYMGDFHGEDIHPIVEFTMDNYKKKITDIPLIKFQWLATELAKKIISSPHRNAILSYGQVRYTTKKRDSTEFSNREFHMTYYSDSEYVKKISELCCKNGIQLVIIEMPGFKETRNRKKIGPYSLTFGGGCQALLYNYNYYNFCRLFDPGEDWIGNSHLNQFGAEKLTSIILMELMNSHF